MNIEHFSNQLKYSAIKKIAPFYNRLSQIGNCYKPGFVFICRRIKDPGIPKDVYMRTEGERYFTSCTSTLVSFIALFTAKFDGLN